MQVQNLQISPTGIKPVINVSQNDVGRQFQLVLYDGTTAYNLPSGTTARIDGIKPDRKGFSYSDAVTVSGNVVTVTTKQQMTIVAGTVECEIRFSKNGTDIGTLNFKMLVEPSPINEDTDISETDLPAVIEQGRQNMLNSEAWAVGKRDGVDVPSTDDTYHNNSKYYSQQAASSASTASTAATNAANSASTASTKASEASASATNAANSAATAAASSAHPPYIGANGNWYVWNTNTSAYVDSGVDASITVQIADVTMLATTATPYVTNTGTNTDPIFHLFVPKGAGIASIEKTGTAGLVDTYTITFTDGQTTTFDVTNGAAGRGIASITKTGTAGLVDTYTITYTDGTTSTYDVTNGQDGTGATLQTLADVNLTNLTDGDILAYDSTSQKFENEALATVAKTGAYSDLSGKPNLGTAAAKNSTNAVTSGSTALVESGAVYSEVDTVKQALTSENLGNIASLSALETALTNLIPNIELGAVKPFIFSNTANLGSPFPQATGGWSGTIQPRSNASANINSALVYIWDQVGYEIAGFSNNGTFIWYNVSANILTNKADKASISQYIETIGEVCVNPNGYKNGALFLASDGNTYKALSSLTYNTTVLTVGTNCRQAYIDDVLENVNGYVMGSLGSLSALENALTNLLQMIGAGSMKTFCFSNTANFSAPWPNLTGGWSGWILPRFVDLNSNTTSSIVFVCSQLGDTMMGFNNNGTYIWKSWTTRK